MSELNLSETMWRGLRQLEIDTRKTEWAMAHPTESTGRALLRRGLVEEQLPRAHWGRYRLTDLGRQVLLEASQ